MHPTSIARTDVAGMLARTLVLAVIAAITIPFVPARAGAQTTDPDRPRVSILCGTDTTPARALVFDAGTLSPGDAPRAALTLGPDAVSVPTAPLLDAAALTIVVPRPGSHELASAMRSAAVELILALDPSVPVAVWSDSDERPIAPFSPGPRDRTLGAIGAMRASLGDEPSSGLETAVSAEPPGPSARLAVVFLTRLDQAALADIERVRAAPVVLWVIVPDDQPAELVVEAAGLAAQTGGRLDTISTSGRTALTVTDDLIAHLAEARTATLPDGTPTVVTEATITVGAEASEATLNASRRRTGACTAIETEPPEVLGLTVPAPGAAIQPPLNQPASSRERGLPPWAPLLVAANAAVLGAALAAAWGPRIWLALGPRLRERQSNTHQEET